MKLYNKLLSAAAVATTLVLTTAGANAAVFSDPTTTLSGLGLMATPGYTQSFFFTNPDNPASQNIDTIEAFLESQIAGIGNITQVGGADFGTASFNGAGNSGTTNLAGSIFSVHIGAGELVFIYANSIANFTVSLIDGNLSNLTDVACGGQNLPACGTGLSNIRVFNGDPGTDVPLPGAAVLLLSALAGTGVAGRMRSKKSA